MATQISRRLIQGFGALLACASLCAQATVTVYTDQGDFKSAYDEVEDTFNDLTLGASYGSPLARSVEGMAYTVSSTSGGLLATGPFTQFPWISADTAGYSLVFDSFSPAVTAIGARFFAATPSGGYGDLATVSLTLVDGDGAHTYTFYDADRFSFVGFATDAGLISLTLSVSQGGTPVLATANQLMLAAVPEPSTALLWPAGLGLLGWMARRRRGAA